jgi:tetratricopeptide (TPR) repeat protein
MQDILTPFAEQVRKDYDLTYLLGQSHQALGEFAKAIQYYNEGVDNFGVNVSLLNALGECYLSLGEREEALVAFQKSLEIDPDQPKVKELLDGLKQ